MIKIGLDLSINSTGLFIGDKAFCFPCNTSYYTKTGNITKWYKFIQNVVSVNPYVKYVGDDIVMKHNSYKDLSEKIVDVIAKNIKENDDVLVVMEGYSYSSSVGPLIDLVTLGTLVRDKIISNGWKLKLISPKEVKYFAGESTYPKTFTNKKETKWKYVNGRGITAGRFKKEDILLSILDNDSYNNPYIQFIKTNENTFKTIKLDLVGEPMETITVPKPIDDINDAFILKKYGDKLA